MNIKKILDNDEILELIKKKYYKFLSEYEKKLLNIYLNDKRLIKYKKEFIISFTNRLNENSLNKYISNLKNKETNNKLESRSKDYYFNQLIDKENYDELFNLYGLKEIERDSNLFEKRK